MHKNADTRFTIQTLLEKNGYKVTPIASFDEYIKKINNRIDLVILDGLMPRDKIIEIAHEKNIKVAYLMTEDIPVSELKLYKNVIGSIEEPTDINLFLRRIKQLLK